MFNYFFRIAVVHKTQHTTTPLFLKIYLSNLLNFFLTASTFFFEGKMYMFDTSIDIVLILKPVHNIQEQKVTTYTL